MANTQAPEFTFCCACLFFDALGDAKGLCRRYAPRPRRSVTHDTADATAEWPVVLVHDSCGDAQPLHT